MQQNPPGSTIALTCETAGASTVMAGSSALGLQRLLGRDLDVLVSDIAMPHLDGIAFMFIQDVRTLLTNQRCVPAVALTAVTGRRMCRHCGEQGSGVYRG